MIDNLDTGKLKTDVARRLRETRQALSADQQSFGEGAGLSQPQYNQYETGKRLLSLKAAIALCSRYLLTLDWLYRGDPSGLPYNLHNKIMENRRSNSPKRSN